LHVFRVKVSGFDIHQSTITIVVSADRNPFDLIDTLAFNNAALTNRSTGITSNLILFCLLLQSTASSFDFGRDRSTCSCQKEGTNKKRHHQAHVESGSGDDK
jgi:hypothetical protein